MLDIVGSFCPQGRVLLDRRVLLPRRAARPAAAPRSRRRPRIRDHIREAAGLPVTIGIARTRTLAKLFATRPSRSGPSPSSTRDHERELLAQLPVTEISGIAGRRAARLAPYGIRTCLDLADADGRLVKKLLTKTGHELWLELNGTPGHPDPARAAAAQGARPRRVADGQRGRPDAAVGVARPARRAADRGAAVPQRPDRPRWASQVAWKDGELDRRAARRSRRPTDRFDDLLDAARVALRRAYVPDGDRHPPARHRHRAAARRRGSS